MDAIKSYEKILILEDDGRSAQLQRQQLERHGYIVDTVSTCERAIAAAQKGVDLVVLVHSLGDTSGLEICKQFRRVGLDLPIVLVTGTTEESPVVQALRCGVQDVVPKSPQFLDQLPEAVERVLQQARAQKKLQAMEARHRQSQKMEALGQLAGGVAHEFNNLLQIIQGFTESVHEQIEDRPELRDDLQQVLDAASRAATITGQLLAFGRRQSMEMEAVDMRQLITEMMKMMRRLLGRGIKVETHFDPDLKQVWGSEAMLGQVVMNLCLNARDAMAESGRLSISCSNATLRQPVDLVNDMLPPGNYVRVEVSDTGAGIPPEHLSHLYEPFYTTKPVGQGTGLGLATVFGVVKEHAGAVKVQSTVGEGTTFTIYLPQVGSESRTEPAEAACAARGTETLLVADDEPAVRQYLERVLTREGYHVLSAVDGEQAVEMFRRHRDEVDLLVLDMVMPKLVGRSACQAIRAIREDVKCVLVSGFDPESGPLDHESGEGTQMLQKPILRQDLLRTVRELLDERPRQSAS